MSNLYMQVQRLIVAGSVLQQIDAAIDLLQPEMGRDDVSVEMELAADLLGAAQVKLHAQAKEIEALRRNLRRSA